jgi:UDP:flavonoid glycosyltransferase YjiC (YdhE family)
MKVWTLGSSFERPPAAEFFPPMAYWEPSGAEPCAAHDATVLPHVNQALARHGMAPLPRLTALFDGVDCALATLPELAHYGGHGPEARFCGPLYRDDGGVPPQWPAGDGPRVFVYVSPSHPEFRPLMEALRVEKHVAIVLARGLSAEAAARLAGPHLRLEAEPLQMQQVMAQADLVVSHGGMGTASAALLAGKPQLLLPNHMEQAMVGRRVADAGLGIALPVSPAVRAGENARPGPATDWRRLLRRVLNEPAWAAAARSVASRHAGASPAATAERVADHVERSLRPS